MLARFAVIRQAYTKMVKVLEKHGTQHKDYKKYQEAILNEMMAFRFSAKQVEALCDSLRTTVEKLRGHERSVMEFCVNKSGMPRAHFIKNFPGNECNLEWLST